MRSINFEKWKQTTWHYFRFITFFTFIILTNVNSTNWIFMQFYPTNIVFCINIQLRKTREAQQHWTTNEQQGQLSLFNWTFTFKIWKFLKQASPKAANIHNRWWRERSERNLRFHSKITKRPRRGRTQASYANIPYVRPLRGRSYHHFLNRRLRCLRQLNQRLWIFAAFGDACSNKKAALGMIIVWIILLSTRDQ